MWLFGKSAPQDSSLLPNPRRVRSNGHLANGHLAKIYKLRRLDSFYGTDKS